MLVTEAEALSQLQVQAGAVPDLSTRIERVGAAFATACAYPPATPGADPSMEPTEYTLRLTGIAGHRELDLTVYPVLLVADVTAVDVDDTGDFEGSEIAVASTDYTLIDGRRLRLKSTASVSWPTAPRSIRVTFTAGYAPVPAALKRLVCSQIRHELDMKAAQGKTTNQGTSFTAESDIPDFIAGPLGAFLLPRGVT
jgi:hypothetical protein